MGSMGRNEQRAAQSADRYFKMLGANVEAMDQRLEGLEQDGLSVTGINFRAPQTDKPDWLVVVKGVGQDGTKLVAFSGGPTFAQALTTTIERLTNRSLKWREDQW